jgi:hypothetical protein
MHHAIFARERDRAVHLVRHWKKINIRFLFALDKLLWWFFARAQNVGVDMPATLRPYRSGQRFRTD